MSDRALVAALAITEHYRPDKDDHGNVVVRLEDASAMMSGRQARTWSEWSTLPYPEQQRVGRMINLRPAEAVRLERLQEKVTELARDPDSALSAHYRAVFTGDDGLVDSLMPRHGRHPFDVADKAMDAIEDARREPKLSIVEAGVWEAAAGSRTVALEVSDRSKLALKVPHFRTAPHLSAVLMDLDAQLRTAGKLDRKMPGTPYRRRQLKKMFTEAFGYRHGQKNLVPVSAGVLKWLSAPTGMGKSVWAVVLCVHMAELGVPITLVVGENDDVYSMVAEVSQAFELLRIQQTCVPLTSPNGRHEFAYKAVKPDMAGIPLALLSSKTLWRIGQAGYGCAVKDQLERPPADWDGREACRSWVKRGAGFDGPVTKHYCRFVNVCEKFDQLRAAQDALVVITTHAYFRQGRTHLPVWIDHTLYRNTTMERLLLARSAVVFLDEVDKFQSMGFDADTSELVLACHGQRTTVLRDLVSGLDHVPPRVSLKVRPPVTRLRYLAEQLLDLVAAGVIRLNPLDAARLAAGEDVHEIAAAARGRQHWYQASRWDRDLLEVLIGVEERTSATQAQLDELQALLPPSAVRPKDRVEANRLRPALLPVHRLLTTMVSLDEDPDQGVGQTMELVKDRLREALRVVVMDNRPRDAFVDDDNELPAAEYEDFVVRETAGILHALMLKLWLTTLERCVFELANRADELRDSGLRAATSLADGMGVYGSKSVIPFGPLGRLIIGFRFSGIDDPQGQPKLRLETLRGDSHAYTADLGDTVALALAGHQRVVLGVSATGYFPGAARTHLIVDPTWWMCDDNAGRVDFYASTPTKNGKPVQVGGGRFADRDRNTYDLGHAWAPDLFAALERLRKNPATRHRARAIVAVNSYVQVFLFLAGVLAGITAEGEFLELVAAEPDSDEAKQNLPPLSDLVRRLTRDRFVELVRLGGQVLAAPTSRIARALNLLVAAPSGKLESAVALIALAVRPVMPLDSIADLAANVAAYAYRCTKPSADPAAELRYGRTVAFQRVLRILSAPKRFTALPQELKNDLIASMLVELEQLVGRGRRGQTDVEVHFLDGAFHDTRWGSDLPQLIRDLFASYTPNQLQMMGAIHGRTAESMLDYAAAPDLLQKLQTARKAATSGRP
ncbi:hypothetical protein GCM10023205_04130 [Yinghuangia aomiensis]|uniref:Helicase ATP-binding domain-containing protein n=1 Tax=Yinghuangia aomiensis TaxID=676205 RepID=A0ABP9GMH8_9ACTN